MESKVCHHQMMSHWCSPLRERRNHSNKENANNEYTQTVCNMYFFLYCMKLLNGKDLMEKRCQIWRNYRLLYVKTTNVALFFYDIKYIVKKKIESVSFVQYHNSYYTGLSWNMGKYLKSENEFICSFQNANRWTE